MKKLYIYVGTILSIIILGVALLSLYNLYQDSKTNIYDQKEQQLLLKTNQMLSLMLPNGRFFVTVAIHRSQPQKIINQIKRTPQSMSVTGRIEKTDTIQESNTQPEIVTHSTKMDLPGMSNIISSTNLHELKEQQEQNSKLVQDQRHVHAYEKEAIYYNEENIQTTLHKNRVSAIILTIFIDPDALQASKHDKANIQAVLYDILPISKSDGDIIIIKPLSIKTPASITDTILDWLIKNRYLVAIILVLALLLIGIEMTITRRKNAVQRDPKVDQDDTSHQKNTEGTLPNDVNQVSINDKKQALSQLVKTSPQSFEDIIYAWMEQDNESNR